MRPWKLLLPVPLLCFSLALHAQPTCPLSDVTQPGDLITASSPNSPGSEGAANAIDNQPTKYLNFDAADGTDVGFVVTPSAGVTLVTGLAMQSANDAPERDPRDVALDGSNAASPPAWDDPDAWERIVEIIAPPFTERFQTQTFYFENTKPYRHYRWVVLEVQDVATANSMQIAEVELLGNVIPSDVTQPGDPIVASSPNSPGSEGAANAIDNQPTKYLNFDAADGTDVGFVVSPSIGRTLVTGMSIQSANDAPERDPRIVALEGSHAEVAPAWNDVEAWIPIVQIDVPPFTARFQVQTFLFDNYVPYRHYRWVVLEVADIPAANSMQVAEVELLGTGEPKDVTQPGDPITASSPNSPGSEGAANAIDNQPTKYLNFDAADGTDVGFVVSPSIGTTRVTGMTIQSANDAPERDPRFVALDGSNAEIAPAWDDDGAWIRIVEFEAPPFTERFQVQEFFFPNQDCYLHYRWVVLEVQDVATANSMQVAEVELLAVTDQADCEKARILTPPADTPVLPGEPATFFTVVNGPWPVQWRRNGERIPGATQLTYTTGPITAAEADDVYSVEIVGCEISPEVQAILFSPSETKSIGISFEGGGANGAPTEILPTDIAGVHLQAYWNSIAGGTGELVDLVNSDNDASTITVQFASSGTWGAGTGNINPQQRLLNGLIFDNPGGDPGQIQFQNVPAGEHTVIAYTVGIPLQFQEQDYWIVDAVTSQPIRQVYTLQMNADQFNPNPVFVRGTSPDPDSRTLANYVRFDKLQPDSAGNITLRWTTTTTGFDRGVAINAVQLLLDPPEIGEPPILVRGPRPTESLAGGTVVLDALATGDGLTYQWRKNGVNLPASARISGVTTPQLTIRQFGAADVGFYSLFVRNDAGSIVTPAVKAKIVSADRTITDTLITHFRFDETSGFTAVNSGSDPYNGEVDGFADWVPGRIGNAIEFAGGSWLFVDNYTKITEEVTIAAWVNVHPGMAGQPAVLIRNASGPITVSAPLEQFDFGFVADTTDPLNPRTNLRATIAVGPNLATVRENAAFPLGEWQHVAFTADGGQIRLYRNGELVAIGAYLDPINQPHVQWLSIGARLIQTGEIIDLDPDNFQALDGRIDDLAIWRTAWTQDVIQSIYEQGLASQNLTTASLPELPPVPTDIVLDLGLQLDGSIQISWSPEQGVLQSSSNVGDPASWTAVPGNPNPYVIALPEGLQFFRVLLSE
jgi:hypothetical protein